MEGTPFHTPVCRLNSSRLLLRPYLSDKRKRYRTGKDVGLSVIGSFVRSYAHKPIPGKRMRSACPTLDVDTYRVMTPQWREALTPVRGSMVGEMLFFGSAELLDRVILEYALSVLLEEGVSAVQALRSACHAMALQTSVKPATLRAFLLERYTSFAAQVALFQFGAIPFVTDVDCTRVLPACVFPRAGDSFIQMYRDFAGPFYLQALPPAHRSWYEALVYASVMWWCARNGRGDDVYALAQTCRTAAMVKARMLRNAPVCCGTRSRLCGTRNHDYDLLSQCSKHGTVFVFESPRSLFVSSSSLLTPGGLKVNAFSHYATVREWTKKALADRVL